jgi:hypothetical protein
MTETFTLSVTYHNKTREFTAELRVTGYTHRIVVMVDKQEVVFEPDEERNYRAVIYESEERQNPPEAGLIKAIAGELEEAFKNN